MPKGISKVSRAARAVTAALIVVVLGIVAPRAAADDAAREWNQAGGNAGRTGAVDLEPVRGDAVIAWRRKLPGEVLADPVTWGGVVFVVAKRSQARELLAFRIADGEPLGTRPLPKGRGQGRADLATWQGVVVVRESDRLSGYPHKGSSFGLGWQVRGTWSGSPCVSAGHAFACALDGVHAVDVRTGNDLGPVLAGQLGVAAAPGQDGRAAMLVSASLGAREEYKGTWLIVHRVGLRWDAGKLALCAPSGTVEAVPVVHDGPAFRLQAGSPVLLDAVSGTRGAWYFSFPGGLEGAKGDFPAFVMPTTWRSADLRMSQIRTVPVATRGRLHGFAEDGTLISQLDDGSYLRLVEGGKLPAGARPGPATLARDVIYFGNWAVDVESGRVLWCLADETPATPAIPAADQRLVFGTTTGELVCVADGTAPAVASSTSASAAASSVSCSAPRDVDGVLLADGRQIEGSFERIEERIRIAPTLGEPFDVGVGDVVLAERAGQVEIRGDEYALLTVWRSALRTTTADELEAVFRAMLAENLVSHGRRVLADARALGMDPARADGLDRLLTGKSEHPNADLKFRRLATVEEEARARAFDAICAGAAWCAKRGARAAAAVLLGDADRVLPGREQIETAAREVLPPGFPWAAGTAPGRTWIRWAGELLPAGAWFVPPDDPAWKRAARPPWNQGAILLRTRNLALLSAELDPSVVGACLRNGEGAVRALESLLGCASAPETVPMEVRLHRDRKAYLAEHAAGGGGLEWSAGNYSPSEQVSRFYVPRDEVNSEPLGRGLYEVLAHELTHHYVDARWMAGSRSRGSRAPGYWIVEGIARFVEDQAVEMGRRALRFDDPTVPSLDAAAQVEAKGKLFDLATFVDLSQDEFHLLGGEDLVEVQLRNTLRRQIVSARNVFYEQAGSLTFFMLHRRGPEGRRALIEYLRAYYRGAPTAEGWKRLGFASAAELEREFRAFLAELR